MSEYKHTPGPWHQVSHEGRVGVDVRSAFGRAICATYGVCNQPKTLSGIKSQAEEDRANARLISAAPEMYEALKAALPFFNNHRHYERGENAYQSVVASLAKADGQ